MKEEKRRTARDCDGDVEGEEEEEETRMLKEES